jgi:AhpD family alkylhydroperoxidase
MSFRLSGRAPLEGAYQHLIAMERYVREETGLERSLIHLIKLRTSQINGCAFCLAMHTREARQEGEREDRLAVLSAWRETGWFSDRERAALAWTEAVTELGHGGVPDEVFEQARAAFDEKELADLTLAIVTINGWNRFAVPFQSPPARFTIEAKEEVAAD